MIVNPEHQFNKTMTKPFESIYTRTVHCTLTGVGTVLILLRSMDRNNTTT